MVFPAFRQNLLLPSSSWTKWNVLQLSQCFDNTFCYHLQGQWSRILLVFPNMSVKLWSCHLSVSLRVLFGSDMGLSELFTTINNRWHVCVGSWWGHYRSRTSNEGRAAKIPMCVVSGSERFVAGSLGASCRLSTRALRKNFPEDRKMPSFKHRGCVPASGLYGYCSIRTEWIRMFPEINSYYCCLYSRNKIFNLYLL
jgi:hypothetical protein